MTTNVSVPQIMAAPAVDAEKGHRVRMRVMYYIVTGLSLIQLAYGLNYYLLSQAQRALSPKHELLKPSGVIGLHAGMVAFFMFLIVYLYAVRKIWPWLGRQGSAKHWLDFHILLGITAPILVTFHSSFKFSGLAGVAFWLMVMVVLSGIVGRYIYAQIPRSLSFAEVSLKEANEQSGKLAEQLKGLGILSPREVDSLVRLPNLQQSENMSLLTALWKMMVFDMEFPIRIMRLRQKMLWSHRKTMSLVGLRRTENAKLEAAIATAREQVLLAKKILFLSKTHQMLHLWHLIHRPFSYSFALLASIHVILMVMLGYYR
jgi:hypothetical protein